MIDRDYGMALLVWALLVGIAVGTAILIVPRTGRRRAAYSTALFSIPLSIIGFTDAIGKQLGLAECSGGVVATALLIVVTVGLMDRCFLIGNSFVGTKPGDE